MHSQVTGTIKSDPLPTLLGVMRQQARQCTQRLARHQPTHYWVLPTIRENEGVGKEHHPDASGNQG